MNNVEIIKVHAGQILPCGRVTGNKEFTIGGLMALKFFPETTLLLKVDRFERILNWVKTDGMDNDHSSSCNL